MVSDTKFFERRDTKRRKISVFSVRLHLGACFHFRCAALGIGASFAGGGNTFAERGVAARQAKDWSGKPDPATAGMRPDSF
jgi:hypothetical protein